MKPAAYIREHLENWIAASKRFPVFVVWVSMLCIYLSFAILLDVEPEACVVWALAISSLISLNLSVFGEMQGYSATRNLLWQVLSFASATALFILLPGNDEFYTGRAFILVAVLILVLHVSIGLLPFIKAKNEALFLSFNMKLFEHLVLSGLMSSILFSGLSLAVFSVDALFNASIGQGEMFGYLAVWIFIWLNSLNFLSSFPLVPVLPENTGSFHSRFFKIFVNYICIPVTLIYALILYAYGIKVIFYAEDIKIWITSLCTWFFSVGIFSYLCSQVFLLSNSSSAASWFVKKFYQISIVPLLLYFYSAYIFIEDKGITEVGYYLVLACIFVLIVWGYMLISKVKDQRIYSFLLIFMAIFSIVSGPINVWNLSLKDQNSRLMLMLEKRGNVQDGVLVKGLSSASTESDQKMIETLYYLNQRDGLGVLKRIDQNKILGDTITLESVREVLGIAGLGSNPIDDKDAKIIEVDNLPAINLADARELQPLLNNFMELKTDFSGYKITAHGSLACYQSGKLTYDVSIPKTGLKSDNLSFIKDDTEVKVFFTYLRYRDNGKYISIEDMAGVVIKYEIKADSIK